MPQLKKGARQVIDLLLADVAALRALRAEGKPQSKHNPDYANECWDDAGRVCDRLEERINNDLAALLVRQAPEYDQRLDQLEQRIKVLEAADKVTRFRKEA